MPHLASRQHARPGPQDSGQNKYGRRDKIVEQQEFMVYGTNSACRLGVDSFLAPRPIISDQVFQTCPSARTTCLF